MNAKRRTLVMAALSVFAAGRVNAVPPAGRKLTLGFLNSASLEASSDARAVFEAALRERGYVAGRNLEFVLRFAEHHNERIPALAGDLVAKRVDIIVAGGTPATLAAQKATSSIPIIAVGVTAPVGAGMAKSLGRPGYNITGVTNLASETSEKRLEILMALAPGLRRIGWMYNPDNPAGAGALKSFAIRGKRFRVEILGIPMRQRADVDRGLGTLRKDRIDAIYLPLDAFLNTEQEAFAAFALAARLPSMGSLRQFVTAGGLAYYSHSIAEQWSTAADQIDRIVNGAGPGTLPFVQPTKFELGFNRSTAAALGITIPKDLLLTADLVAG